LEKVGAKAKTPCPRQTRIILKSGGLAGGENVKSFPYAMLPFNDDDGPSKYNLCYNSIPVSEE